MRSTFYPTSYHVLSPWSSFVHAPLYPPASSSMEEAPPEVLAHIFSLTMGNVDLLSTLQMVIRENSIVLTVSGVCRRWRQVALGCGRLWETIAFSTQDTRTVRCAEVFLERSRGVSLSVHIHGSGGSQDQPPQSPVRSIILKLSKELHRIRACKLNLPPPYILEVWTMEISHMVHLAIRGDDHLRVPPRFANQIERLQMISISGCLKWPVRDFRRLVTAVLENEPSDEAVSVNDLLEPFDGTPNLSNLVLSGYSRLTLSRPFAATLPTLRKLDIRYCDAATLLNHLHVPSCAVFSVTSYLRAEGIGMTHRSPFTYARLPTDNVTALSVVFDIPREDYRIETLHHSGVRTQLIFRDSWETPSNSWVVGRIHDISRFTPFFSITSLEFYATVENVPWLTWLACLPNVTTIEIALSDYTNFLGSLMATATTTMLPLCPKLRTISISTISLRVDYSQLKSFLTFRIERGLPLTHITIPACDWDVLADSDDWWESIWSQGIISPVVILSNTTLAALSNIR